MGSYQQYANAIDEMIKKRKEKGALVYPPPTQNTHTQTQKNTKVFY